MTAGGASLNSMAVNSPDQVYSAAAKVGGILGSDPAKFIGKNLKILCNVIDATEDVSGLLQATRFSMPFAPCANPNGLGASFERYTASCSTPSDAGRMATQDPSRERRRRHGDTVTWYRACRASMSTQSKA
jgi:hypothetical protein